jgi:hypothetical protein
MRLLVHVEQYDVIGILPSQLESLGHLVKAMGVTDAAFVDGTVDGIRRTGLFIRYENLKSFMDRNDGPFIGFSPSKGDDIRDVRFSPDAWLVFGPSMGNFDASFDAWVKIPGGELSSRDAVPIALWETSKWQVQ